ncbi:Mu transposase C-terminal domain-containing protein (plasmid) [Ensifer adhaerens]|uniref:Mu transposase C-terminal domain-containing protein n=1 Tax=Ensifer adhaerens TaxID=106592 RepID=UPI001CBF338B|nr:Mu transposase C-terminal domain-containing protein [Ensifer adhaerens]MBZ7927067.1 Mu transposase C-terminal domain-containing protein [Ensifer adhaerens]UAX98114.1 Mu transposase C-terminal domain-containing protein [Ensifer adhaerens]UAY05495.1 Mu transposase C-terminal domain-containing protein [Ensifer adhaerens]UAY12873.1 Mu transposase C-terminal domain-containing protein [Ensifer adhaerens]
MSRKPDKFAVEDAVWLKAVAREAVILPLASKARLSPADVGLACRQLEVGRARLYELLGRYRTTPATSSLLDLTSGPQRGRRRLAQEMEAIIETAMRDTYRRREKPSITALHDRVRELCRARSVHPPSWKAVKARVALADPKMLARDREGAKAARDRFAPAVAEYCADHALHIVQIDHTLVDIIVVDAVHRRPLQRPWLTLAIDVASRVVAGFYLSLESPSSASVALAVQHMVMPKGEWLEACDIKGDWPVFGLPEVIHVDNAREFHGKALVRGAAEHGIMLVHRPVARPHYGGHIERLIGTMMGAVHLLPGTTSSDVATRGTYDSEKHATMTLDELERWLALEIVGRYHAEVHRSLSLPPVTAWGDAVAARPEPLRLPQDAERFLQDFLPFEERSIRRDGVHLFGLRYWDDVLSAWAGRLSRRLRIRYDPRDLSCVFVEGPDGINWPIRFADLSRPRITLGEHRMARAALKERGVQATDEQLIFETIAAQRALVEAAARDTKAARRRIERRDRSLAATAGTGAGPFIREADADEELPIDLPPLTVEEWS